MSFYRIYRPIHFADLVGQDHIRTTLMHALQSQRVAHAYLFTGPRGTGKTSTARLLARALNCEQLKDGYEPCGECAMCSEIGEGRLIDLVEIDAASNRGIDEVRDLKENISFAPTRARCKIYIIDEVHMMTTEAFNALLKTLEEPPSHTYFILATTEIHKIPATIISRCQRFDFGRITVEALTERLRHIAEKEGISAEERALETICRYAEGGLRDAIGLMEQLTVEGALRQAHVAEVLGLSEMDMLRALYDTFSSKDTAGALRVISELYTKGLDLHYFLHEFIAFLRDKMLTAVAEGAEKELKTLLHYIAMFQEAQADFYEHIPQLSLEIAAVRSISEISVPVVAPTAASSPAPVAPRAPREHQPLTPSLNNLIREWKGVLAEVRTPFLRTALTHASLHSLKDQTLTLAFTSAFYLEKSQGHEQQAELEHALSKVTGMQLKIECILQAKPLVDAAQDPAHAALDVFGGELM